MKAKELCLLIVGAAFLLAISLSHEKIANAGEKAYVTMPAAKFLGIFGVKPKSRSSTEIKRLEADWEKSYRSKWVKWEGVMAGDVAKPPDGPWHINVRIRSAKYLDSCGYDADIKVYFSNKAGLGALRSGSKVKFEAQLKDWNPFGILELHNGSLL